MAIVLRNGYLEEVRGASDTLPPRAKEFFAAMVRDIRSKDPTGEVSDEVLDNFMKKIANMNDTTLIKLGLSTQEEAMRLFHEVAQEERAPNAPLDAAA